MESQKATGSTRISIASIYCKGVCINYGMREGGGRASAGGYRHKQYVCLKRQVNRVDDRQIPLERDGEGCVRIFHCDRWLIVTVLSVLPRFDMPSIL